MYRLAGESVTVSRKLWKAIKYEPHRKQVEFHESQARFRVAVCGRRFGKSKMAAAEAMVEFMKPNSRGWIVGPLYSDGENEFKYMWDYLIAMGLLHQMTKKAYNVRTGEMYIESPWGSRVDVKSAQHADGLVGKGLHWLIVSEAAKQSPDVWEKYLRPALADHRGWAIFPSTPEGFNWFHELYQLGQSGDPEWESWRYPSWENPYVYPLEFDDPEVQSQMRTPDDPWFWQEIGADFRSVVGLIYPEFDERKHVKPHTFRPQWANELWCDWGYTNHTAVLDVQIDAEDNVYIWREYYERQKPASMVGYELAHRLNPDGYRTDIGYGDSASPEVWVEFMKHLPCRFIALADAKDWQQGVGMVRDWLRDDKLFIDPSCVNFLTEITQYKTSEPKTRDPRMNVKEEPMKRMDHAMDAMRYGFMHKFVLGLDSHVTPDMFDSFVGGRDEMDDLLVGVPGTFRRDTVL